jgi:hypothetical protein
MEIKIEACVRVRAYATPFIHVRAGSYETSLSPYRSASLPLADDGLNFGRQNADDENKTPDAAGSRA